MAKLILYIGIGGFLGTVGRFYLASFVQHKFLINWPYGTFAVNIIGCFLIGLIYAVGERTVMAPEWRLFLATGLCGGLTTFSAFSIEIVGLLRGGQFLYALTYTGFSLMLGLAGVWAGLAFTKWLF
jgi:CrcB protein